MSEELELTVEFIKERWSYRSNDAYDLIAEDVVDYDEGRLTTSYIWKSKASGRFYSFCVESNSWDDGYDEYANEDGYQIEEVFPTEVTVTQYLPRK